MDSLKQAQKLEENQETTNNDLGIKIKQLDQDGLSNSLLYKQFSFILNHLLRVMTRNEQSYRYKMHLGLCKMMEFNELELVYWHLLNLQFDYGKKLQPNYSQEIKTCAFNYFKDFLKIQAEFIPDISLYKRELLFVTLSAFYTIKLMRNNQKFDKIGEFIKEEKFGELFKRIEPAFINVSQQLTLYIVNQKYMEMTKLEEPLEEQQINYNFIVEQILEMAPAYQKDEELPVTKKVKRQKKLMVRRTETIQKQELESQQKIEQQSQQIQQLSQQFQYQGQQQQQIDLQYLNQPIGLSIQFQKHNQKESQQYNQMNQSQIQADSYIINERSSFQYFDKQYSNVMSLRSRALHNVSQESLGQLFSNQYFPTPSQEQYTSRNQKSIIQTNKNGK
ncbi:unnamed protein product (macronuclear) [Paramecium tetraurelia]|uniref:Chromosome undetermined scaffold_1, whole genome shotgun sequence n=1 Tax=Paramecium tetraurelia TaxID=5888 RepID=Q6BFV1_PARTE|nr:hypothetical protein [Paramecium tetraurelia strain d4-2]XP_001423200.1 uncharacterized protein GSPATT00000237001 [Paramecium tetraurelia]CAH03469.1 hypothetical protein PTMB.271c [Paramecium tetraurelia]CAK55802.1 unnamed protein product [Paramecium tetraurelia]|eukprot:XP_001423200.1 hypothetical protein (macronuclear) [Paramecium tetraurelia strain d4-2]